MDDIDDEAAGDTAGDVSDVRRFLVMCTDECSVDAGVGAPPKEVTTGASCCGRI